MRKFSAVVAIMVRDPIGGWLWDGGEGLVERAPQSAATSSEEAKLAGAPLGPTSFLEPK